MEPASDRPQSLYDFHEFAPYVKHVRNFFPHRKKALTYQKLASLLGYSSPRLLSMIENAQRLPSEDFAKRFANLLSLKGRDKEYFQLLVRRARLKNPQERDQIDFEIEQVRKLAKGPVKITNERFKIISEWYHLPVVMLAPTEGGKWTAVEIAKKLRGAITVEEAQAALERLQRAGFLFRRTDGTWAVPTHEHQSTEETIPSAAVQRHHCGMARRAESALSEVITGRRDMNSHCFRMDPERLPEAKAELQKFMAQFNEKYSSEVSSEVYQLNLHLFPHT